MDHQPPRVSSGKVVSLRYTLTDTEGTVLDQSGDEPMDYLHGEGNIVPGLERELEGRAVGDKFRAVVSPEDGYGERDGESQQIPRSAFPDGAELEVGMQVVAETPEGDAFPLWVVGTSATHVELDPNHPLAGETLTFDVEVLGVRQATEEEMEHGHVHGPGGHHHHDH